MSGTKIKIWKCIHSPISTRVELWAKIVYYEWVSKYSRYHNISQTLNVSLTSKTIGQVCKWGDKYKNGSQFSNLKK